jgi:hypothetical protein
MRGFWSLGGLEGVSMASVTSIVVRYSLSRFVKSGDAITCEPDWDVNEPLFAAVKLAQ